MPWYDIKVTVEVTYEVEANSQEEAEIEGWNYQNYLHFADVYSIEIDEQPEEDNVEADA